MKKIFFAIVISFCAVLNVQGQTNTQIAGSIERKKQDLIIDTTKKRKLSYYKAIVQYVLLKKMDSLLVKVEFQSGFPEEADYWKQYLIRNLSTDTPKKNKAKPGTYEVIVHFIVSKDGYSSDISASTNVGYGMEADVVRALKKGPIWFPATQNGNVIKSYRK
jgi:hypothetical protein